MSLEVTCPEHLEAVRAEAVRLGKRQLLEDMLAYLDGYGLPEDHCLLGSDPAPLSFQFVFLRTVKGVERRLVSGGLIYHPDSGKWQVHT